VDGNATFTSSFNVFGSQFAPGESLTFSSNEFFNPSVTHAEGSESFVAVTGGVYLIELEVEVGSVIQGIEGDGVVTLALMVDGTQVQSFDLDSGSNAFDLIQFIPAGQSFSFENFEGIGGDTVSVEGAGLSVRFTLLPPS
jgi:hypothetical protein